MQYHVVIDAAMQIYWWATTRMNGIDRSYGTCGTGGILLMALASHTSGWRAGIGADGA